MKLKILFYAFIIAVLFCVFLYYFGHHNIPLSRSFLLEKEIRRLHFFEMHEPTNYLVAHKKYIDLKKKIRFYDTGEKLDEKYNKAIRRSLLKWEIVQHLEDYKKQSDKKHLIYALHIFESKEYKNLSNYHGEKVVYEGRYIDEKYIHDILKNF